MTYIINGSLSGGSTVVGTGPGTTDIINLYSLLNTVLSNGANETVNSFGNMDTIHLGAFTGLSDSVNLSGSRDFVDGNLTTSFVNVGGGTGDNTVNLINRGGTTMVSLGGYSNRVTLNANAANFVSSGGSDLGDQAFVTISGAAGAGAGWNTAVMLNGTHNHVSDVAGATENATIGGGSGFDTYNLGNGNDTVTDGGGNNVINTGNGNDSVTVQGGLNNIVLGGLPGGVDSVNTSGTDGNKVTAANANTTVTAGAGSNNTIHLGNGVDSVSDTGDGNKITAGNGADTVNTGPGSGDTITLGNGADTVNAGSGSNNTITLGNGNDHVTDQGANNTITVGNGADMITAGMGDGDTITAGNGLGPAGPDQVGLGSFNTFTGRELRAGSVINSRGWDNTVSLWDNSSARVNDLPTGGALTLELNGTGTHYTGNVTLTGFANDIMNGQIDFNGIDGGLNGLPLTSFAEVIANSTTNVSGGINVHMAGGGVLNIVGPVSIGPSNIS